MADVRMIGGKKMDDWVKRAQAQKEPSLATRWNWSLGTKRESEELSSAFHSELKICLDGSHFV